MLEKYQLLSPREKVLVVSLLVMIFFTLAYQFIIDKQITAYQDVSNQLAETRQQLAKAKNILGREKIEQERAREVEAKLNTVLKYFDTNMQAGKVLVSLNWQADQCGVNLEKVKPMSVVDKNYYLEIPATIKVSGLYNNVVDFIRALEKLPNVSEIRRADFRSASDKNEVMPVAGLSEQGDWQQSGQITVELDLVLFSGKQAARVMEQAQSLEKQWAVGRSNPFQSVAPFSPVSEIAPPKPNQELNYHWKRHKTMQQKGTN